MRSHDKDRELARAHIRQRLIDLMCEHPDLVDLDAWQQLYAEDPTLPPPPGGPAHWRQPPLTLVDEV